MPLRLLLLLTLCLGLAACDSLLAHRIVQAPNTRLWPAAAPATQPANIPGPTWLNVQRTLTIPVPNASLSAWVLEPPPPPSSPSSATAPSASPRATILVLHGIAANSFFLLPTAEYLRHAGYRVVLVDLRGHGQSTGEFITYDSLLNQAGQLAHFDPDQASPLRAITQTHTPILLLHGDLNMINPTNASRQLNAAAPDHTQLTILKAEGHLIAQLNPTGQIKTETLQWFQENLHKSETQ